MTSIEGVWGIGDIRNTPFKQAVVLVPMAASQHVDRQVPQQGKEVHVDWVHR